LTAGVENIEKVGTDHGKAFLSSIVCAAHPVKLKLTLAERLKPSHLTQGPIAR
jgi:hypothetical protein